MGWDVSQDYYSETDVCRILDIAEATLTGRISRGTGHPPFIKVGRVRLYPKDMFKSWLDTLALNHEVKSAS